MTPVPIISVSLAASCLRMANISSCLLMALAFSTPASSAKLSSAGAVLTLQSWSFISLTMSCMEKLLRKGLALRWWENGKRRAKRGGVRKFIPEMSWPSVAHARLTKTPPARQVRRPTVTNRYIAGRREKEKSHRRHFALAPAPRGHPRQPPLPGGACKPRQRARPRWLHFAGANKGLPLDRRPRADHLLAGWWPGPGVPASRLAVDRADR